MTILKDSKADVLSDRLDQSIIRLKPMTTAQRDKLVAEEGMLINNSTLVKLQGYENGAWFNLI